MAYPLEVKKEAVRLRRGGRSIKEIARELGIAVGTSSVWLTDVELSCAAMKRLENKQYLSRLKSRQTKRLQKKEKEVKAIVIAEKIIQVSMLEERNNCKILCACLYWAEGSKKSSSLRFTNSDPEMIATFLSLLRKGFDIDERKLRALLHVHTYHNEKELKKFWSLITNIPLEQFSRSHHKNRGGKRKKSHYKGCLAVSYFDVSVLREIKAIYRTLASVVAGGKRVTI